MKLLFANNAATTLASGINATATTIIVATGTGAKFPNPGAGEAFYITLQDAATELTNEIALCTSRTGDALIVQRGQQDTTAVSWNAGDVVAQLVTRGDLEKMIQPDQLQEQVYTASGATGTNSITATLDSELTTLPDSLLMILRAAGANTGSVTLTLTLGTTVLPAHAVVKYGGSALNAQDIPAAGYPMVLIWSALLGAYVLTNPASGTAGSIAGGVANNVLIQTAPGTTGFVPAPTIAGQVLAFVGGVIAWAAAAVTSFNGRSGAVSPQTGDYNATQVGAIPAASVIGANQQVSPNGFQILPGGIILQWGRYTPTGDVSSISFPKIFPNQCFVVIPTGYTNDAGSSTNVQAFGYQSVSPCPSFQLRAQGNERPDVWLAIGY